MIAAMITEPRTDSVNMPQTLSEAEVAIDYGLKAQVRLLPYALGFFGIGLPIYVWAAHYFLSAGFIGLNLALFGVVWAVFFFLKPSLKAETLSSSALRAHFRRQWLCGGLWAISLMILSLAAIGGGAPAEIYLMICAGAAVGIIFFSAPILLFLLTLGPLAMIGPIIALHRLPGTDGDQLAHLVTAGLALALAFGLILNRHLQEHYRLEFNQLRLSLDREAALQARDSLSHSQVSLMHTLSVEVATGLKGLEQSLSQSLNLLQRAPAPRHYVESALSNVEHLLGMITTTLDEDTARSGQLSVAIAPIDIEGLARAVVDDFQVMAHAKGLELEMAPASLPTQGAVMADPQRVEQVLSHLLSNALQYTPKGRVEVKLITLPDGLIRLEVVDSGPGLDEDELRRAFAPHERIVRTSSGHSGAGLGLSLSQSLAVLMNGRLGAQSTPDVGSKFWIDLPFDPAAIAPRPIAPESDDIDADSRGLRVLLLSNDSLRSAQLRESFETMGHRCLTSTTRARALSLASKGEVDAVVIATGALEDLSDPENRQGFESWLQRLRETQQAAHLTIVALLPEGDQVSPLQEMGLRPLLLPQSVDGLRRALMD